MSRTARSRTALRPATALLSLCLLAAAPTAALAKPATPVTSPSTAPSTAPHTSPRIDTRTSQRTDMLARRTAETRALVEKHFAALAAGDATAVRALWTRDARVVSIDAAGTATTKKLPAALTRWLSHTDGLQWEITGVRPITDRDLEVTARVVWNGATYDDTLRIRHTGKQALIRHKSSRPHAGPHVDPHAAPHAAPHGAATSATPRSPY
jgi:hypothetical protein